MDISISLLRGVVLFSEPTIYYFTLRSLLPQI